MDPICWSGVVACVAGVQRGGRGNGEVECERVARSLGAWAPNDRASRSHSTSPLPPLCTPATQASGVAEVCLRKLLEKLYLSPKNFTAAKNF